MRLELTGPSVVTLHPPIELVDEAGVVWDISVFDKTRFSVVVNPFHEINSYWEWILPNRRIRIFEIYKKISLEMSSNLNNELLIANLQTFVEELYKEMPLEEITHFVRFRCAINYPDFKEQHDLNDKSPERTYLISEYKDLVVLTFALRGLLPIWGRYMGLIKKLVKSNFKEFYAIRILSKCYLHDTPAMERLKEYIQSILEGAADNTSAILAGLSSTQLIDLFCAIVVIRRLSAGDLEANEVTGNIVSNIHTFVRKSIQDIERKFGKTSEKWSENTPDDDQSSKIEDFRTAQEISIGSEELVNVFADNHLYNAVYKVDPTVPKELIDIAYSDTRFLVDKPLLEIQQRLVEWTLPEVISPYSTDYISKIPLINLMAATHALLWHWGMYELAVIASGLATMPTMDNTSLSNGQESISATTLAMLNQCYPYQYGEGSARKTNPAYIDIITTSGDIVSKCWYITTNVERARSVGIFVDHNGQLTFSRTLNEQLALLAIKVEEMRA